MYTEAHRLKGKLTSKRDVATADGHGLSRQGGSVVSGLDDGTRRRPGGEEDDVSGGKEKQDLNSAGSGYGASRGVKNEESEFVSGTNEDTSLRSQRPDKGIVEMRQV